MNPKLKAGLIYAAKNAVNASLLTVAPAWQDPAHYNWTTWLGWKHMAVNLLWAVFIRELMVWGPKVWKWSQTNNVSSLLATLVFLFFLALTTPACHKVIIPVAEGITPPYAQAVATHAIAPVAVAVAKAVSPPVVKSAAASVEHTLAALDHKIEGTPEPSPPSNETRAVNIYRSNGDQVAAVPGLPCGGYLLDLQTGHKTKIKCAPAKRKRLH